MIRQSTSSFIEAQRRRQQEKEAEHRRNMTLGLIFAPVYLLGWIPIVWVVAKVLGK
jgi:hypothetical protein